MKQVLSIYTFYLKRTLRVSVLLRRPPPPPFRISPPAHFSLPSSLLHCLPSPASTFSLRASQPCTFGPPRFLSCGMFADAREHLALLFLKLEELRGFLPVRTSLHLTIFTCFCLAGLISIMAQLISVLLSCNTKLKAAFSCCMGFIWTLWGPGYICWF